MPRHACHGFIRAIAAGCGLLWAIGCARPFDASTAIGPPLQKLREIDAVGLEERSRSDPITVEEAAQEALEELIETPEPPQTRSRPLPPPEQPDPTTHVLSLARGGSDRHVRGNPP